VGTNTFGACIDQTGSTSNLVVLAGGSGLGSSFGGGSSGGGGGSSAITTWGGATLAAATAWGVAPSGNVIGVNANIITSTAIPVTGTFWQATQPVSGTFWQATQPISAASLPLPAGASTSANQASQLTQETATATALGTPTDAVGATPSTSSAASLIALAKAINNNVSSAIPAGTNYVGQFNLASQYPNGATPLTASATGTTAATTATLAGVTGKTTYICSLSVRANATANANVTNTVTGIITGTLSRAMWIPANTAGLGVDEQIYNPCVPASGTNQAIAVVSGAPGTGGVVTVNATGYQQ
jgi:hypothetical protein